MEWLLRSNNTWARLLRTLIQGILGVLTSYLPEIVGLFDIPDYIQAIIVAIVMAILSPIMSEIGKHVEQVNMMKRLKAINLEDELSTKETAK